MDLIRRTEFWIGVILTAAVAVSIVRRKNYPTFVAWWNAEGIVVWIIAGMFSVLFWTER